MAADTPTSLAIVDGLGAAQSLLVGADGTGKLAYQVDIRQAGALVSATNPLPTSHAALTPAAATGSLIGNTASQTLIASVTTMGWIQNPLSAGQQGIGGAESIFIDITGANAVTTAGGTSFEVAAGTTFMLPGPLTTPVKWIATTNGHKINAWFA